MKLKEVIKEACEVIEWNDVLAVIDGNQISDVMQVKINKLISYFNKIQDELASEFIDVFAKENVEAVNEISYSNLSNQILDVVYIKDKDGKKLSFTCYPDKVSFEGISKEIVYTYVPQELNNISNDIVFLVPKRVYSYGIAREFYFFEGLIDKAEFFENRFKSSINSLLEKDKKIQNKTKIMPERKWL